jgi:hypothetical protein
MKKCQFPKLCATLIFCLVLSLSFFNCTKSPEKRGDSFLKAAEKAKNPKVKEEREKKAYLKYLEAINYCAIKGKKIPNTLKEKLLRLTLQKLNRELSRYLENPEEANVEQIGLWREDFKTYLPGISDQKLIADYSQFLLSFANPDFMEFSDVMSILNEVVALKVLASQGQDKINSIKSNYSNKLLEEVASIYKDAEEGLRKKKTEAKEELVLAEYKALQAVKYDPHNKKARNWVSRLRKILVDTYSGYERFFENAADIDPEIDKYDIYLCIPNRNISSKIAKMEVALWNLTASPINVRYEYFYLVTNEGDTIQATKGSRFHKILVDTKTDTAQALVFKLPVKKPLKIKNLLYSDGKKISEKFFY